LVQFYNFKSGIRNGRIRPTLDTSITTSKNKKTYLFWEILKKYRFWYIPGNYPPTVLWIRTVSMRIGTQLFSSLRIQFRVRILVGFCRRKNFYMQNILYLGNNIGNIKNLLKGLNSGLFVFCSVSLLLDPNPIFLIRIRIQKPNQCASGSTTLSTNERGRRIFE